MVIMILQKTPKSVKGDLTRWLFEVKNGVYIGHVSGMVRDRLWERCIGLKGTGSVFQAWTTNNEQHFAMRLSGDEEREIVDWEGVQLIMEKGSKITAAQKRRIKH